MDELASPAFAPSLSDDEVSDRLTKLDSLLEQLETLPQPGQSVAVEAVELLTEVYGAALARVAAVCGDETMHRLAGDELVSHLLVLHGLHPETTEQRIAHALDDLRPLLDGKGDVELTGISDGVAHVQLSLTGCASSAGAMASSLGDVVLAAAPELIGVDPVTVKPPAAPALIPVESLIRRPRPPR